MIKRYEVYWVGLDPTKGKEMQKTRPCVVVSPDEMNQILGTVVVAPVTSTIIEWPFRTKIKIKEKVSSVACDQLRTITKEHLGKKVGILKTREREEISRILLEIFAE